MFAALRAIDTGGNPKFPPGDNSSEIHAYMAQEEGGPQRFGQDYPGSLVFFEADIFPTMLAPFPLGFDFSAAFGSTGQTVYSPNAQANIEFLQDIAPNTAPQPNFGEDDEYNMGFGVL
jgi:hypothetical protein